MSTPAGQEEVYLEVGQTRTFAIVPRWPGWCRSGRDESSALQALVDYAPRYARALAGAPLAFHAPVSVSALWVADRLPGSATTDFGAPALVLPPDAQPVDADELERLQAVIAACWAEFDRAAQAAAGMTLRKGPRGGGRELDRIIQHAREADAIYLSSLGGKAPPGREDEPARALEELRRSILETLVLAARGEVPARGPRGGARWSPRYFVRRLAWHALDHAWEIEDRAGSA